MLQMPVNPINELKQTRDMLALEFFSVAPATNFLKTLMPELISSFSNSNIDTKLPEMKGLNKDQSKFLKTLKDVPFTEIGELRAYVPEGMNSLYLDYLNVLLPVTESLKTVQSEILQPYTLYLAQLVSDKTMSISTNSKKIEYANLENDRDKIYSNFSNLYNKNSHNTETNVKGVVERNNDWLPVFSKLNQCTANVNSINRELLQRQIKQCVDYLEIINDNLDKEQMKDTSRETAARLSNGAYQVAKTCELFSTTYYRVLTMNGSIENTVAHILKTVG